MTMTASPWKLSAARSSIRFAAPRMNFAILAASSRLLKLSIDLISRQSDSAASPCASISVKILRMPSGEPGEKSVCMHQV